MGRKNWTFAGSDEGGRCENGDATDGALAHLSDHDCQRLAFH